MPKSYRKLASKLTLLKLSKNVLNYMKLVKNITTITYLLVIFVALNLAGCDPAKLLVVEAERKGTSVTLYLSKGVVPQASIKDSDTTFIRVPSNDILKKKYHFGLGGWSDTSVGQFASGIDSIVIENGKSQILLRDRLEIESFLKKRRSGYAKAVLTIKPME